MKTMNHNSKFSPCDYEEHCMLTHDVARFGGSSPNYGGVDIFVSSMRGGLARRINV